MGLLVLRVHPEDPLVVERLETIQMALSVLAAGVVRLERHGGAWTPPERVGEDARAQAIELAERWVASGRAWRQVHAVRDSGRCERTRWQEAFERCAAARAALDRITGGTDNYEVRWALTLLTDALLDVEQDGGRWKGVGCSIEAAFLVQMCVEFERLTADLKECEEAQCGARGREGEQSTRP